MSVTQVKSYTVADVTDLVLTPDTEFFTVTYGEDSAPAEFCFYDSAAHVSYVLGTDGEWAVGDFTPEGKFYCGSSAGFEGSNVPSEVKATLELLAAA